MKLDDVIKEAFDRETCAVPERRPSAAETVRACGGRLSDRGRGLGVKPGNFAPLLVLAAVSLVALCLDPASVRLVRPLATQLAATIPEEAGSRFLDFMLEAGESYRSFD
jgi:hypothetical protein